MAKPYYTILYHTSKPRPGWTFEAKATGAKAKAIGPEAKAKAIGPKAKAIGAKAKAIGPKAEAKAKAKTIKIGLEAKA